MKEIKEMESKIQEIQESIKTNNIKHIYLNFVDISGKIFTKIVGAQELVKNTHVSWFDGISLNGQLLEEFQNLSDSDWLVLLPDPFSFRILPFIKDDEQKSAVIFCKIKNHPFDTRGLLKKAVQKCLELNVTPMMGTQLIYSIEGNECQQNFYETLPTSSNAMFHNQFVNTLINSNIEVEYYMSYGSKHQRTDLVPDISTIAADKLFTAKWFVKSLGLQEHKTITFENLAQNNLSSCPVHISLWKGKREKNLFFDADRDMELSELGENFIKGILYHQKSIKAIQNICTSQPLKTYKTNFSTKRDNCIIQVPLYFNEKQKKDRIGWSKRCIYNGLNATCNYYLMFATLIYAGIYGIQNKISNLTEKEDNYTKIELIEELENNTYFKETLGTPIINKALKKLEGGMKNE